MQNPYITHGTLHTGDDLALAENIEIKNGFHFTCTTPATNMSDNIIREAYNTRHQGYQQGKKKVMRFATRISLRWHPLSGRVRKERGQYRGL